MDRGWITSDAFANNALAADAKGRSAMQDGFIQTAKVADEQVTDAKLSAPSSGVDGLYPLRVARATYDFAEHGGAVSTIGLGVTLPDNAIVTRAWYEVLTALLTAGAPHDATVSIDIPVDDVAGILAAIAISDGTTPWAIGLHDAIQDGTLAAFAEKTTAAREISITIGVEAVTAGKFIIFAEYIISD